MSLPSQCTRACPRQARLRNNCEDHVFPIKKDRTHIVCAIPAERNRHDAQVHRSRRFLCGAGLPAAADTQEPNPFDKWQARVKHEDSLIKAWAYAHAIEEYCFGESPSRKLNKSVEMLGVAEFRLDNVREKASEHLGRDQTACQPAADFVERIVADLPPDAEVEAEYNKFIAELVAATEAKKEKVKEKDDKLANCKRLPALAEVYSGHPASFPGYMERVDKCLQLLSKETGLDTLRQSILAAKGIFVLRKGRWKHGTK